MNYLANLCHNCTECIHACQYSPPHQFAVNVPMALAKIRLRSYEKYCWPRALGWAFLRWEAPFRFSAYLSFLDSSAARGSSSALSAYGGFVTVLTLFVSLPYGKFMHGLYRTAALIRYARESRYD